MNESDLLSKSVKMKYTTTQMKMMMIMIIVYNNNNSFKDVLLFLVDDGFEKTNDKPKVIPPDFTARV